MKHQPGDTTTWCRAISHPWAASYLTHGKGSNLVLVLRCPRCKTTRTDQLTSAGASSSRAYGYAKGYCVPKGRRRSKAEYRAALIATMPVRKA